MIIDSKRFDFKFFLSNKNEVSDLEKAAREYGGATKNIDTGETFSNVPGSEFISIKEEELNILSVYIPDTMNVDQAISKEQHKAILYEIVHRLYKQYGSRRYTPIYEKGLGSWYSEELQKVVYDNIIIASVELPEVKPKDIEFFIKLARFIKRRMKQEAVTVTINDSMGLV